MFSKKHRNQLYQAGFVAALIILIGSFLVTAHSNLTRQGITSGFGFLERGTGWDLGFSFLPFQISDPYWWTLTLGMLNTVIVGYLAITLATFLGVGLASMRVSGNPVLNRVALAYVELIRNVPPILQVLAWYALFTSFPAPREALHLGEVVFLSARGVFLPALHISGPGLAASALIVIFTVAALLWVGLFHRFSYVPFTKKLGLDGCIVAIAAILALGVIAATRISDSTLMTFPTLNGFNFSGGTQIPPELITILVSTMVYGSAYIAEVVRGGFLSVDPGKIEAGRALGMSNWLIFSRIQLPLTVRNILPMMTNQYVWLIKATTLGIAVGFGDLFMVVVSSINQSGQTMELILILACAFWLLNGTLVWIMNGINNKLQRRS